MLYDYDDTFPGWSMSRFMIGKQFQGKGYGKQLLNCLTDHARDHLGAKRFVACCRKENMASKGMQLSCGFSYHHSEEVVHPRDGYTYTLDYYEKEL